VSVPEGNTHPDPAWSPQEATGPGSLPWLRALQALDDYDRGADLAYEGAALHGTGSLAIGDSQWPHLAEGQFGHWHWASDDTITRGMPAIKAEVA
jgi:hypothetical protein